MSVGPVDGSVKTKLPALPGLQHVAAKLNDDSAEITFDPVDGALDYRVYPLPADDDITVKDGGEIVVKNGVYRCGGDRETAPTIVDDSPYIGGGAIHAIAIGMVGNFARTLDDAVLGYVYTDPAPDRTPVYALGDSDANADVNCFWARWDASRSKKYTTSKDEHDQLVAAGGTRRRDSRSTCPARLVTRRPSCTWPRINQEPRTSSAGTSAMDRKPTLALAKRRLFSLSRRQPTTHKLCSASST